jgi:hypothetical protein
MFISLQRWELDLFPRETLGSIRFASDGSSVIWNERFLFTPDKARGEELDAAPPPRRIPIGYSQRSTSTTSSASGRFTLTTKTSLQPDGYYDHIYVTDVMLLDSASEHTIRVTSYEERDHFLAHMLTDQGVLVYSRGEQLVRFDALAAKDRFTTLAKGWRGLLKIPGDANTQVSLVGIDPDSAVGTIELALDGSIARIQNTTAPWMGYVEDVDGSRARALLAMLDSTGAGFVSIHKRIGLVDIENNRHLHSDLFDANIRAAILCPGKDEVVVLCHDRSLHWLRADW